MPETQGAESYVEIAESDPEQAHPSAKHMAAVQAAHAGVAFGAHRCFRNLIQETADQVTEGMTTKRVAAQQQNVERQDDRANPNSEML